MEDYERLILEGRIDDAACAMRQRVRTLSTSPDDLGRFGEIVFLAARFVGPAEVDGLVDLFRSPCPGTIRDPRVLRELCTAMQAASLSRQGRRQEAMRQIECVEWSMLRSAPMIQLYRISVLLENGAIESALQVFDGLGLLAADSDARSYLQVQIANCLTLTGQLNRAWGVLAVAAPRPTASKSLIGLLGRGAMHYCRGKLHSAAGRYELAVDDFELAYAAWKRANDPNGVITALDHFLYVASALGQHEKCRELLDQNPIRSDPARRGDARILAVNLTNRALLAIQLGDADLARRLMNRTRRLSPGSRCRKYEAHHLRCLALLDLLRGARGCRGRALRLLRQAEGIYRSIGLTGTEGLSLTLADRADVHLRRGEIGQAIECLGETLELVEDFRDLRIKARCVLVKSYLLLEKQYDASKEDLYEEILRELGVVHSPVLLFEIVANLYMFSWDLDERLDITDNHFRQLEKMRGVLDADVFHLMYRKYVSHRVARRAMKIFFDWWPDSFSED